MFRNSIKYLCIGLVILGVTLSLIGITITLGSGIVLKHSVASIQIPIYYFKYLKPGDRERVIENLPIDIEFPIVVRSNEVSTVLNLSIDKLVELKDYEDCYLRIPIGDEQVFLGALYIDAVPLDSVSNWSTYIDISVCGESECYEVRGIQIYRYETTRTIPPTITTKSFDGVVSRAREGRYIISDTKIISVKKPHTLSNYINASQVSISLKPSTDIEIRSLHLPGSITSVYCIRIVDQPKLEVQRDFMYYQIPYISNVDISGIVIGIALISIGLIFAIIAFSIAILYVSTKSS